MFQQTIAKKGPKKGAQKSQRLVHALSVGAFLTLWGVGVIRLGGPFLAEPQTMSVALLLALGLGWALADLASGVVHYIADNCGSPETPIIGSLLIEPFREHHEFPKEILAHGPLERNANNALITLPILAWLPWVPLTSFPVWLAGALCLSVSAWVAVTNEIHALAHQDTISGPVRVLQATGLILCPVKHNVHHLSAERGETVTHYCITSGFCDRILERLRSGDKSLLSKP